MPIRKIRKVELVYQRVLALKRLLHAIGSINLSSQLLHCVARHMTRKGHMPPPRSLLTFLLQSKHQFMYIVIAPEVPFMLPTHSGFPPFLAKEATILLLFVV
jgi:hypothetical protein